MTEEHLQCEYVCCVVAVCNSLNSELEREKLIRVEAETKHKELEANEAQLQLKILDLETQIHDLQAAKVSLVFM